MFGNSGGSIANDDQLEFLALSNLVAKALSPWAANQN